MSPAKVTLSSEEQELVLRTDWILTKNAVIQKVYALYGGLSESYTKALGESMPIQGFRSPKISKGEYYLGLPWVMLDYPRQYATDNAFGIRCFFWWGNFCSITLQLSGEYQQQFVGAIQEYFREKEKQENVNHEWFLGVGEGAWDHHFQEKNYRPLNSSDLNTLPVLPFIKLAKKIPLTEWNTLAAFYEQHFAEILRMLGRKIV